MCIRDSNRAARGGGLLLRGEHERETPAPVAHAAPAAFAPARAPPQQSAEGGLASTRRGPASQRGEKQSAFERGKGGAARAPRGAASGPVGADELRVDVLRVLVEPSHAQLALASGLTHLLLAFDLLGADGAKSAPVRIVAGMREYALRLSASFHLPKGSAARAAVLDALAADDQRASDVFLTLVATDQRSLLAPLGSCAVNLEQLVTNGADADGVELQLREALPADSAGGAVAEHALVVGRLSVHLRALPLLQALDDSLERFGSARAANAADAADAADAEAASVGGSRASSSLPRPRGVPPSMPCSSGSEEEAEAAGSDGHGTPVPLPPVAARRAAETSPPGGARMLTSTRTLSAASPAAIALAEAAAETRRSRDAGLDLSLIHI